MNIEQRLAMSLRTLDEVEPSPDLWTRVVHSIDEDRAHRRRVLASAAATFGIAALLTIAGGLRLADGPAGTHVRVPVMEAIETVALVVLAIVLGPAIRRFGRNFAADLWRATPATATALLRLLDVAYLLVVAGFILLTAQFDRGPADVVVAGQVEDLGVRVGGLLLVLGLLHAITLAVLPVVALVDNSTRTGRKLPRWLVVVFVLVAVAAAPPMLMALIGAVVGLAGA